MVINDFVNELDKIGIVLNEKQVEQFEKYFDFLVSENSKYNLTAITEKKEVFFKHFYDCVSISQFYKFGDESICDIGSGAGFPSIPLKIVFPNLKITIVDSLNKRINFLNQLVNELGLKDVDCVHSRAEEYGVLNRERFDFVTARAVANLPILAELCIPLVKVGGYFIALKGSKGFEELESSSKAITKLGCKFSASHEYKLPYDYGERVLLMFMKEKQTSEVYPRNYGQIKKKPL